jgi:hypothetical protein
MTANRGKQVLVAVLMVAFIVSLFIVVISLGTGLEYPRSWPSWFGQLMLDRSKVWFFAVLTALLIITGLISVVHRFLHIPSAQRPSPRFAVCPQCGQRLLGNRCPSCER